MKSALLFLCLALALITRVSAQSYTFTNANYSTTAGGIAIDASGNVYLTSSYNQTVERMSLTGASFNIAGRSYERGSADGTGPAARFNQARGIVADASGNLFVADSSNHTIRKITPGAVVSTLAGTAGEPGTSDGTGSAARLNNPQGIAIDAQGNLYVADMTNHAIRKITPAGVVTTLAGKAGTSGTDDGTGASARFNSPQGVAVDASGNIFVADTENHAIRKITPAGVVTTFAGLAGNRGETDGTGTAARFSGPQAVAFDRNGTLFVGDTGNYTVRKITSAGVVTTIGGLAGNSGYSTGLGAAARFYQLRAIAVDSTGTLYIADSYGIRLATTSDDLTITVQPQAAAVAAGSPVGLTVTATGGGSIGYQWAKNGTKIAGGTNARLTISSVQASDSGSYSVTVSNSVTTLTSSTVSLTVLAALPNDNFSGAQTVTGSSGTVSGHNNGATGEIGEPTHYVSTATSSSVWYKWVAPQTGTAVIDFTEGGYNFALAVYTGSDVTKLTRIGSQGYGGRLLFTAESGTTYYVAIGSVNLSQRGNFTLRWRMVLNDSFAQAELLPSDSGRVSATNDGATGEPSEPTHLLGSPASSTSVWYKWIPSQNGAAIFDMAGSMTTMVLAAYTGDSLATLKPVAAGSLSGSARLVFEARAGTTYYLAVGSWGYGGNAFMLNWQLSLLPVITNQPTSINTLTGSPITLSVTAVSATALEYQWYRGSSPISGATAASYTVATAQTSDAGSYSVVVRNSAGSVTSNAVSVSVAAPPSNDRFTSAQALIGLTGSTSGSNMNATAETGEPIHWNANGTASSVWYKWTTTSTGYAVLDTVGSAFDTVLAVYTGTDLLHLSRVTQDDDRGGGRTSQVNFAATAGITYYVAVGGGSGGRGSLTLNWQLSPSVAITTQPTSQTVVSGASARFTVEATGTNVTYQWLRNGTAIPGATASSLAISNVQGGSDASYSVVVTSSTGTVTSAPATLAVATPIQIDLKTRTSRLAGGLLWSIAGGNDTLVAVGTGGNIMSSSDKGTTWVPRISGNNLWLVAVTYGNGQFVIVGEAATILTSPDGITWKQAASVPTKERINNVIYADGKFVAVGEGGVILTSTDAQTWTVRNSGVKTWLHGLAYNAKIGAFAANGAAGVILVSNDAITWTQLPVEGLNQPYVYFEAVVPGDSYSEFVAVGHVNKEGEESYGICASIHQNQLRLKTGETFTTWTTEENPMGRMEGLVGLTTGAGALFATGTSGKIISAKDSRGPWYTIPSGTDEILLGATFYKDTLYVVGGKETVLQSTPLFSSRLINISTRGQVGTGSNVMISGFVVTGTAPKQILVRAAGPALASIPGVSGALAKPVLTVIGDKNVTVGANSGWSTANNAAAMRAAMAKAGAFPFADGSADCALLLTLNPGMYTAKVEGASNSTGLALVEVYDLDPISDNGARTINISTRGVTSGGSDVMTAGFVIEGAASRRVLIRATGPALSALGVGGTVAEPQLALYNGKGVLTASATAWGLQPNADEIRGVSDTIGAFALPESSKDSAMLLTLMPGAYTAQVTTPNSSSGVTLIEVYDIP